ASPPRYYLMLILTLRSVFFFFNDTATTQIYTLSLHDALPICCHRRRVMPCRVATRSCSAPSVIRPSMARPVSSVRRPACWRCARSEEHTSELQSRGHLVCRLLLEKKKKKSCTATHTIKSPSSS